MKNCSFTGHRKIKITTELKEKLKTTLETLIKDGITDFYAGGALGFDMLCEITVLELRKKYPIKLHLVLPCSMYEQTSKWNDKQKDIYNKIFSMADSVCYTSDKYTSNCMKIRNEYLVQIADCLVCYYDINNSISGTGQTVRMSKIKNIKIINIL